MATLTIRGLDDQVKARLRVRAARNGHSMEEEARQVLRRSLESDADTPLGTRIAERFSKLDGAHLEIPERTEFPRDPGF